jgi:putative ABC transport system permease protein
MSAAGEQRGSARAVPGGRVRAAWAALTGTGAAASVALALLVLAGVFIAVAVPRASLGYRTQVLQRTFGAMSSSATTVLADADISGLRRSYLSAPQLTAARGELAAGLRRAGLSLAPGEDWSGMATGSSPFSVAGQPPVRSLAPPQVELVYRSGLPSNGRLAAGRWPSSVLTHGSSRTFQVAVTAATAARFHLRPGSRMRASGQVLVVTGIIAPRRSGSSFWTVDPVAAAPRLTYPDPNAAPYLSSAAFVGQAELPGMQGFLAAQPVHTLWSFPLDLSHVTADQAAGLLNAVQRLSYLPAATSVDASLSATSGESATIQTTLSSGLATTLPAFVATDDAVQRVLSLLFVSLAVIAAVVVLLGARLVAEHRRGEFTMMRARGASLRQIALVALGGGAVAVVPAAAVAAGAAVAVTPGPASTLSCWLAGVITVLALAGPPLLAAWSQRTRRRAGQLRTAAARRRATVARRWVADIALACAAIGGLIVLRQQGLPPPGQLDLFTSAAPVLAAVPIALLVARAGPPLLRQLARLAARRHGVVLVVGFARGSAAAQAGLLPVFALVLAFAVVAFAGMARGAVARADVSASWQAAGADAVVTAPEAGPGITPAAQHLITRVPGVQRSATVSVTAGTSGQGQQVPVVIVAPRQYAALTAATPLPPFPAAALAAPGGSRPVPILISPGARDILGARGQLYAAGRQLRFRVAGMLPSIVGGPAGSQFAVLPQWALGAAAPAPTALALAGPRLDGAALRSVAHRAVTGSRVTLRTGVLAGISGAPLPHGGVVTFAQGAAAAAGFSLLILLLTLILSARSRELTLARLATMGLEPAQSLRITAVETLPAILAAAVGGIACALALVPLVGPAVDLAAFTGLPVTVPLRADPAGIGAAVAGLLLVAVLTLTIQSRLARGRGATQALRVGE